VERHHLDEVGGEVERGEGGAVLAVPVRNLDGDAEPVEAGGEALDEAAIGEEDGDPLAAEEAGAGDLGEAVQLVAAAGGEVEERLLLFAPGRPGLEQKGLPFLSAADEPGREARDEGRAAPVLEKGDGTRWDAERREDLRLAGAPLVDLLPRVEGDRDVRGDGGEGLEDARVEVLPLVDEDEVVERLAARVGADLGEDGGADGGEVGGVAVGAEGARRGDVPFVVPGAPVVEGADG
jgi:hypothetical protein